MTAATSLPLVFAFGFATGALTLYSVWRVAVRWMHLHDKHLVMQCPRCKQLGTCRRLSGRAADCAVCP